MITGPPITDQDRQRIRDAHAEGLSRNAIARRVGRSPSTVSKLAAEMGLSFVRGDQVQAATEARKVDAKSRRAALALALLEKAEQLVDQIDQPHLAFNFGGKDNTYEEHLLERPPTGDIRNLMYSAALAVDKSLKLDEYDSDHTGAAAVDAWLRSLIGDAAVSAASGQP